VALVLVRRFTTDVDAAATPAHVRRVTFEEAARAEIFNRGLALASASQRLSLTVDAVERALFADRPSRRMIVASKTPLNVSEFFEAYNLALVQGLLVRSEQVRVEVREHVRAVVRFAKLAALLCTYSVCQNGTRLDVSRPLSILRHPTKYGFALASFFPAVVATSGFRLEVRCVLGGEPILVRIDASDRIARTHKLPKDADSAAEHALCNVHRQKVRAAPRRRQAALRLPLVARFGPRTVGTRGPPSEGWFIRRAITRDPLVSSEIA
jgi:predicted nuclease of restriction endonuclease-like RecB superfamily